MSSLIRIIEGAYAGLYHQATEEGRESWVCTERPDSLPITGATMRRWLDAGRAEWVDQPKPQPVPVLPPMPSAAPVDETPEPDPTIPADVPRDREPLTVGEESFLEDVRTWSKSKRIRLLRFLGVHAGSWMSKGELEYRLLLQRRIADPRPRPAAADHLWPRERIEPDDADEGRERPRMPQERPSRPRWSNPPSEPPKRPTAILDGFTVPSGIGYGSIVANGATFSGSRAVPAARVKPWERRVDPDDIDAMVFEVLA